MHKTQSNFAVAIITAFTGLATTQLAIAQNDVWGPAGDGIPPGWKIIEGDIVVREDEGGVAGTYSNNFWPNGLVPFEFDDNMSQSQQDAALLALVEIGQISAVVFTPHTNQTNYIRIRASSGNNSPVGMQGGEQIINITDWDERFVICHEVYHALGFWHEQSRVDRDAYIDIHPENIQAGQAGNFDIRPNGGEYGPYDFDSVMHYGVCDFSIGCPPGFTCNCAAGTETITAQPAYAEFESLLGNRDHLSYMDQVTMSFIYPESDWRFADISYLGIQLGTFFFPYRFFSTGYSNTPEGGELWLQPGTYDGNGTYTKAMTIHAPIGGVTLN